MFCDVITICLILAGPDAPLPCPCEDPGHASVARACVWLELCGPHESWGSWSYEPSLKWARDAYARMRDAPRLSDLQLFPNRKLTAPMLKLAEAYCEQNDWCQDGANRLWVWQRLAWAQDPEAPWECRRLYLWGLRDWIGTEAYYRSQLPTPVPIYKLWEK